MSPVYLVGKITISVDTICACISCVLFRVSVLFTIAFGQASDLYVEYLCVLP